MSLKEYVIGPGALKLRTIADHSSAPLTILVGQQVVATIERAALRSGGRSLTLEDGRTLLVAESRSFFRPVILVSVNGLPLAGSPGDPRVTIRRAARLLLVDTIWWFSLLVSGVRSWLDASYAFLDALYFYRLFFGATILIGGAAILLFRRKRLGSQTAPFLMVLQAVYFWSHSGAGDENDLFMTGATIISIGLIYASVRANNAMRDWDRLTAKPRAFGSPSAASTAGVSIAEQGLMESPPANTNRVVPSSDQNADRGDK